MSSVPASIWQKNYRRLCQMLTNQPALRHYFSPIVRAIKGAHHSSMFAAKVVDKQWVSQNMAQLTLSLPRNWGGSRMGQHALFCLEIDGKYVQRPFSICSSELLWQQKRQIQIACKVKHNGGLTPSIAKLIPGDTLFVSKPQGEFGRVDESLQLTLICAGSGVTPMRAILKTLLASGYAKSIDVYYRFRGSEGGAFVEELKALENQHRQFHFYPSDSQQIPADVFVKGLSNIKQTQILLCGPLEFMHVVKQRMLDLGHKQNEIHQEHFGLTKLPAQKPAGQAFITQFSKAGSVFSAKVSSQSTLLEAAEKAGADPTFGCRMGVCFQCVCLKVSGRVKDIRTGELSGEGAQQIQLCVSQPVSDVTLEYV